MLKVLRFRGDGVTTASRNQPQPQLSYVGGLGFSCVKPSLVQCYNGGLEGQPIHWVCWAESESGKRLYYEKMKVICEEDGEDDILMGSCRLEYSDCFLESSLMKFVDEVLFLTPVGIIVVMMIIYIIFWSK